MSVPVFRNVRNAPSMASEGPGRIQKEDTAFRRCLPEGRKMQKRRYSQREAAPNGESGKSVLDITGRALPSLAWRRQLLRRIRIFCGTLAIWTTALPSGRASAALLDATTSTDGAQKDTGFLTADASTHAIAADTYNRHDVSGDASSQIVSNIAEGMTKLYGTIAVTSAPSRENQTTVSATAFAGDSVTVNQQPGAAGRVEIATSIRGVVTGSLGYTSNGTAYGAEYRLDMNLGSGVTGYEIMVDRATTNMSTRSTDSGPVTIPVQAGTQIALQVSETLSVTGGSAGLAANSAQCTADYSQVHWYIIPLVAGITLTSESGHDYLPLGGDINLDGTIDFSDLLTLAQHYGASNAAWEQGDFNHDGRVDFADLLILAQNYGGTLPQGELASLSPAFHSNVEQAFAQVPEPCSFYLAGVAAVLIGRRGSGR